jgi:hypothetical protein
MAEFIFTSPGVKFRERDLTFVTRNIGITNLGLVGETQKGAAFEPVFIQDKNEFRSRFGAQSNEKFPSGSLRYQLPYVANSYLSESNQLYVTRILGLSGYDAGNAWAITLSAGVDPATTGDTPTVVVNTGVTFSGGSYLGVSISASGQSGTFFSGFTKTGATGFSGVRVDFTAVTYTAATSSGTVDETRTTVSGTSYTALENMVLGVIRSRATVVDNEDAAPTYKFDVDTDLGGDLTVSANNTNTGVGDFFGEFTFTTTPSNDPDTVENESLTTVDYAVSLDPSSREYISAVLGSKPKGKNTLLWVEKVYPDLIKKLDADGLAYGVNTTLIQATSDGFTNYAEQYQTPETPWVVSELQGNQVERLFKFISISDGDSANKEIKLSIQNIDPVSGEFDVIVRDFNDNDENIVALESFTRCSMTKSLTNYVGKRIGTSDGVYSLKSSYVMLELNEDANNSSFPCGFEGYNQKNWASSATSDSGSTEGIAPLFYYKTSYNADERLNRVYLGISENGYDGTSLVGTGINQNMFNYNGQSAFVKSKGFHLDSGVTGTYTVGNVSIGEFEVGAGRLRTITDIQAGDTYEDRRSRKFTFVPYGGFDGWNVHRQERSNGDLFKTGGIYDGVADGVTPDNDYQAWLTAIDTFANPEEVTVNLFSTPAINWSDNLGLVNYTVDMIETDRADSLYVIDAPDIDVAVGIGEKADILVANDIVDLLDVADIDSSYAATYYPWIQIEDTDNNVNIFLPPTGEVLKAMAFTDSVAFPWFAPAGLQRGVTDALKAKYKLSQAARDILYDGKINSLAEFPNVGTAIFGQKTLQTKESALDRVNVRRLLLQIKVLISNIAYRLLFEQNDQTTIDEFLSKANPVLETIRRERGVSGFQIIMDESNNSPETRERNELFGEIKIKPIRAVEYIGITFTITPEGASFDDV